MAVKAVARLGRHGRLRLPDAGSSVITEVSMLNWISRWAMRHAPTPEKTAASMLVTARMELFAAEQRGIDPWVTSQASQRPELDSTPRSTGPRLAAST